MSTNGEPPLRASVSRQGSTVVVSLSGELDLATADRLRTRLETVVCAEPAPQRVVVDAAALQFVDAAGIAALLGAQRTLADRGGQMVLRSPTRLVRRVVEVLELERLLPIED